MLHSQANPYHFLVITGFAKHFRRFLFGAFLRAKSSPLMMGGASFETFLPISHPWNKQLCLLNRHKNNRDKQRSTLMMRTNSIFHSSQSIEISAQMFIFLWFVEFVGDFHSSFDVVRKWFVGCSMCMPNTKNQQNFNIIRRVHANTFHCCRRRQCRDTLTLLMTTVLRRTTERMVCAPSKQAPQHSHEHKVADTQFTNCSENIHLRFADRTIYTICSL